MTTKFPTEEYQQIIRTAHQARSEALRAMLAALFRVRRKPEPRPAPPVGALAHAGQS
jgi:hypothetical protein